MTIERSEVKKRLGAALKKDIKENPELLRMLPALVRSMQEDEKAINEAFESGEFEKVVEIGSRHVEKILAE